MSEMSLSLEPWAFVAQGVTGAAIERPFEGVVSNEVRARERLLPFQASKEVPDWIRHDRGREKEVPPWWPCALSTKSAKCCPPGLRREDRGRGISARILRNPFITKILQNYYKTLTSKKTQLGSL